MGINIVSVLPKHTTLENLGLQLNPTVSTKYYDLATFEIAQNSLDSGADTLNIFLFYSAALQEALNDVSEASSSNLFQIWQTEATKVLEIYQKSHKNSIILLLDDLVLAANNSEIDAAKHVKHITKNTLSISCTRYSKALCCQLLMVQGALAYLGYCSEEHLLYAFVTRVLNGIDHKSFLFMEKIEAEQEIEAERNTLKEENELLLLHLTQVQEELEHKHALITDKTEAEQAIEAERNTLKEENELLLLQLLQIQEELERYYLKCKRYEENSIESNKSDDVSTSITPPGPNYVADTFNDAIVDYDAPIKHKKNAIAFIRERLRFLVQAKVIRTSALFDAKWYLEKYQDVAEFKADPYKHYFFFGADQGRDPGPNFSTKGYLCSNPDVAEAGMNPLVHFELFGKAQQRIW